METISKGFSIIWDLKIDLPLLFEEEFLLLSLELSLDHFKKEILEPFFDKTKGVILYKGSLDFNLPWKPAREEEFQVWLSGKEATDERKRLFKKDKASEILNQILSSLPEEMPAFLLFDTSEFSEKELLRLTSKEAFPHFDLAFQRDVNIGRSFFKWNMSEDSLEFSPLKHLKEALLLPHPSLEFDEAWDELELRDDVKFLEIPFLTEEWEGVETIHAFKKSITEQAKRKLSGFLVSDGSIKYYPNA